MNSLTDSGTTAGGRGGSKQDGSTGSGSGPPVNSSGSGVEASDNDRTREAGPANTDATTAEAEAVQQERTAEEYAAMPFDELWRLLTDNQRKYVLARQAETTKAGAAERIGMHRDTAYGWPPYVEIAASRMVDHRKDAIREGLSDAATRATQRLTELLDDEDSRTAIKAVKFALEQEIGKATQKSEVKHSGSIGVTDQDVADMASALDHLAGSDSGSDDADED